MRAMKIAFFVLFITVFSYAMSFNLAMGHEQAVEAYTNNISALAMVARGADADAVKNLQSYPQYLCRRNGILQCFSWALRKRARVLL